MDTLRDTQPLERFGNLALDLTNTVVCERVGRVDKIRTPDQFIEWLSDMDAPGYPELVPLTPPGRRTLHVEAIELRTDLDRLFEAFASGTTLTGNALFNVNRALSGSFRSSHLVIVDGQPVLRERHETNGPVAMLAPIATAAATLMTKADPRRLRQCAGADCTRWFLDTSKGGQRQWCTMATCGNRAKSARFRARSGLGPKGAAPPAPSA